MSDTTDRIGLEFDTDILELLPPWYKRVLDYQQICNSEREQLDVLSLEIAAVAENMFLQTMGVPAIEEWENIFKIYPSSSDTIEFRRARILNRVSTKPPFTLEFLYQKLDELIGENRWTVYVDYTNYTLYIESSAENQSYAQEISVLLNTIKPAHIVYVNTPYIKDGVLASETILSNTYIYNYRLGAWGLGSSPFASATSEEVRKLPSVPSIQNTLLTHVATFVSTDVAAARINNSIVITALNKTVDNNELTITYSVTSADTNEITLIELLDSNNEILSSSGCYIPVIDPVNVKHVIPIRQGVN